MAQIPRPYAKRLLKIILAGVKKTSIWSLVGLAPPAASTSTTPSAATSTTALLCCGSSEAIGTWNIGSWS